MKLDKDALAKANLHSEGPARPVIEAYLSALIASGKATWGKDAEGIVTHEWGMRVITPVPLLIIRMEPSA